MQSQRQQEARSHEHCDLEEFCAIDTVEQACQTDCIWLAPALQHALHPLQVLQELDPCSEVLHWWVLPSLPRSLDRRKKHRPVS